METNLFFVEENGISFFEENVTTHTSVIVYNIVLRTCVFRETYCERRLLDFLFEQVLFVQEQYNRRVGEPFIVAD